MSVVELPLRSVAVTAMRLTPPTSGMFAAAQEVVPVAAPLTPEDVDRLGAVVKAAKKR